MIRYLDNKLNEMKKYTHFKNHFNYVFQIQIYSLTKFIKHNDAISAIIKQLQTLADSHHYKILYKFKIKSTLCRITTEWNNFHLPDDVYGDNCSCDTKWHIVSETEWLYDNDGTKYFKYKSIHHCPKRFQLDKLVLLIGKFPSFKKNRNYIFDELIVDF